MFSVLGAPAPTPIGGQTPEGEGFCVRPRGTEEPCLDELLGTLAHELRSPLATIVSAAQVANESDMEPPARRALAVMERQSRQALQIIDDLFDVCAGTGGKLSLRKEVVELADIVAAAAETAGHLVAARQHRLTVSLPRPERETVKDTSQGVRLATMQKLARYWATDYDWRKIEAKLNSLPQFITEIDGLDIHFIYVRSKHENDLPVIIDHGLPVAFLDSLS